MSMPHSLLNIKFHCRICRYYYFTKETYNDIRDFVGDLFIILSYTYFLNKFMYLFCLYKYLFITTFY